jgi:Protein of unknown function (DUF3185).
MAGGSMKIAGIALVVIGLGLAFWGYRLSGSFGSQVTQAFSGADNKVMMFYIGGAVCFIVGLFLFVRK